MFEETNVLREVDDLENRANDLELTTNIETTLKNKIESGNDLTDEEIFIAVETIGFIAIKHKTIFSGFGFENYKDKKISQRAKSLLALEAIEKHNKDEIESLKLKFENLNVDEENFKSLLDGSLEKIKLEAQEILETVEKTPDSTFITKIIDDDKVRKTTFRGFDKTPITNYKDIFKAIDDSLDNLDILSRVSNYESTGSGKESKYDLSKLAKDMSGKIIKREDGKVTYDVNISKLCGLDLYLTVPENSDSNYLMRNLKANFVVSVKMDNERTLTAKLSHTCKSLNKKESIEVLKNIIKFTEQESKIYQSYYKEAKLKLDSFKYLIPVVGHNKLIFKAKIHNLNTVIHYINLVAFRGLMTWVLKSMK